MRGTGIEGRQCPEPTDWSEQGERLEGRHQEKGPHQGRNRKNRLNGEILHYLLTKQSVSYIETGPKRKKKGGGKVEELRRKSAKHKDRTRRVRPGRER